LSVKEAPEYIRWC